MQVVAVIDCRGTGNTAASNPSAAAIYKLDQQTKQKLSYTEADLLLGAAADKRWAFISFRTAPTLGPSSAPPASCVRALDLTRSDGA